MVKNKILTALAVYFFISPVTGNTQEFQVSQLTESDFYSDFPIVLTATRLKQPQKESPIATTIIDRKMIEASGFTEIADLLRLAPNMIVNYDSGHVPVVGYSFLFDRFTVRMQIMIDGRSIYTPIFGEMYWSSIGITVEDIERIEVIRGPSSSSYGPNAMTGVISIITRQASTEQGNNARVTKGSNGNQQVHFSTADIVDNLSYHLSFTNRKNNGFDTRHDSSNVDVINLKAEYQLDSNNELEFSIAHNSGKYKEDNIFSEDNAKDNPIDNHHPKHDRRITNESYQIKWNHTFSPNNHLSVNYYQQEHDDNNEYVGSYVGFFNEQVLVDTPANIFSKRKNLDFSHHYTGDNYNLIWGAIYRTDETISELYLHDVENNKITTKEYYINTSFNLGEKSILNLSYLYDTNDIAEKTQSERIAFNHNIDKNNTIRLSYATSTRTPFIFEEYTNYYLADIDTYYQTTFGTNPYEFGLLATDYEDLSAEEIESYDIGIISNINNSTNVDLRLFKNKLTNLTYIGDFNIDYGAYDNDYLFFGNGEGFDIKGFEVSISNNFQGGWFKFNYAHNEIDSGKLIVNDKEYYETAAPFDNISLLTSFNIFPRTTLNVNYYHTSEMQQIFSERLQDSQGRLDLRLAKELNINAHKANIALTVFNVTDEDYLVEFRPDKFTPNGLGRNGYLSFYMEF